MALSVPIASFKTTITNKITNSDTTIPIDSTTDDDGNSMDGLVLFFVIDKGESTEEYISGTVDAGNSQLTSVTRGISVADGTTSVTGNKSAHRKKAAIEITAHAYLTRVVRMLNGTEEVGGVMQNPSSRSINSSRDIADKEYVDLTSTTAGGITAFATTDEGGLNIGVGAGYLSTADGTITYAGDTGFALTDDSTNYVELTLDGTLVANTTSFTVGYVPIAIVTTASGDITVNTDARGWLTAPSGDILATNDATYGATIAADDVLYLDTADAKWKLADASAEATADGQIGIAIDAGVDTDTNKRVQVGGLVTGLSGLTAGWVFLSDTAGDLSSSAGTYKRIVGYAINTTTMFLLPAISADELTGGNSDLTVANLNEAATFFANTGITGAEAETLTDGSDAGSLHIHGIESLESELTSGEATFWGSIDDGMTEDTNATGTVVRSLLSTRLFSTASGDRAAIYHSGVANDFGSLTESVADFDDNQTYKLLASLKFSGAVTQDFIYGLVESTPVNHTPVDGAETGAHAAFIIDDGTIYSSTADGSTQTTNDVSSGITLTDWNEFRIERNAGTNVLFYINGSLVATHTTNLPATANSIVHSFNYVGRSASDQAVFIKHPYMLKITGLT